MYLCVFIHVLLQLCPGCMRPDDPFTPSMSVPLPQRMQLDIILTSLQDHTHVASLLGYSSPADGPEVLSSGLGFSASPDLAFSATAGHPDTHLAEILMKTLLRNLGFYTVRRTQKIILRFYNIGLLGCLWICTELQSQSRPDTDVNTIISKSIPDWTREDNGSAVTKVQMNTLTKTQQSNHFCFFFLEQDQAFGELEKNSDKLQPGTSSSDSSQPAHLHQLLCSLQKQLLAYCHINAVTEVGGSFITQLLFRPKL